jgi:hypothetical protein
VQDNFSAAQAAEAFLGAEFRIAAGFTKNWHFTVEHYEPITVH